MNEPNSDRVEELFELTRHVADHERDAFLSDKCGSDAAMRSRVEALLHAHDESGRFLQSPLMTKLEHVRSVGERIGDRIGPYILLQLIGEGGFGSVYLAEQREPVRRNVALKIIKLGMDTRQVIARFEVERQALAMMNHPNIAKVFDAGMTSSEYGGRPYFVMEHVQGLPITDFCDQHRMTTADRLALFVDVCHAVEHAHQKGVIHRDIKPSNVLVFLQDGQPVPKVIDFGIAKATGAALTDRTYATAIQQFIGTLEYMSPEQARSDNTAIDTRSDIYSLGVLLYELLTGVTPFDRVAYAVVQQVVRDEDPAKPSNRLSGLGERAAIIAAHRRTVPDRLGKSMRGDLDWIVMKALEKDPARRYSTATEFAGDISRNLANEPVSAGPPSHVYRARKFIRRNRVVVFATAAVSVALVLALVGTGGGLLWALQEQSRANEQARVAEAATVQEAFARVEAEANARRAEEETLRAERELERAVAAETDALQQAEDLSLVYAFTADQLTNIEMNLMGHQLRTDIVERLQRRVLLDHVDVAEAERQVQEVLSLLNHVNFTDVARRCLADSVFAPMVETAERQFSSRPLLKVRLFQTLVDILLMHGLDERSLQPALEGLDIRQQLLGSDDVRTLNAMARAGKALARVSRYSEAEQMLLKTLEGRRRALGDNHLHTVNTMNAIGEMYARWGKIELAEPLWQEAVERSRKVFGEKPVTANSLDNMGALLRSRGELEQAEQYTRHAHEIRSGRFGKDQPGLLYSMVSIGEQARAQDRFVESEQHFRQAMEIGSVRWGDENPITLHAKRHLAALLEELQRIAEAESLRREVLDAASRPSMNGSVPRGDALFELGRCLLTQGRFQDAEPLLLEACQFFDEQSLQDRSRHRQAALQCVITLYEQWHAAEPGKDHDIKAAAWQARREWEPRP